MNHQGILSVTKAEYLGDFLLRLWFSNGEVRVVDFSQIELEGVCLKLRDLDYFRQFTLDPFTVDWNNEIGFAPEFLYENSHVA